MYEELKAEMKRQGISGNRLAIQALISPSDYYSAINGNKPFYPAWRKRIAELLGVNENDIFSDDIKTAKWVTDNDDVVRCSNCGGEAYLVYDAEHGCIYDESNYCPDCGAKMKGSQNG